MLIKLKERYRYSFIVLKEMVRTDFKLRYQGSFLGIAWSVLKPLMLFCVMYVVFVKFLKFTDGTPTFPWSCCWVSACGISSLRRRYGIDGYRRQRGHSA